MKKTTRRIIHFVITIVIIGLGAVAFIALTASKPQLERTRPPAPVPMVQAARIITGPVSIVVRGEGTVQPLREIQVVPQVSGKVIYISTALVNGGTFKKDDVLLRIDPVDYKLAVTLARARVKDAESKLRVTEEEAAAALEEWRLLYNHQKDGDKKPPALVVKEPQLEAAKAQLAADRADYQKALLNLGRTEIRAPFNGRVYNENVDVGQYVSVGQALASLFSTEAAEIVVPLEDESLFWFDCPGFTPGDSEGSAVKVNARIAGRDSTWQGTVVRAEGKLDERTRMINVIVRVEKPYATRPPLVAGLFVTVEIQGQTIESAAVIPRAALKDNDLVWVVDENGLLTFRKVEVARRTTQSAILSAGIQDGEMVVTSTLKAVTDGMSVRISNLDEVQNS